jgi:predicted RNase H-like HicB family nuclease
MTYKVHCEWDETGWWVVTVLDVPGAISQSRRLDQVPNDIAEAIELMTGEPVGSEQVELTWTVPGDLGAVAERARGLREDADRRAASATKATQAAARALRREGFSYRDIGTMTGVSYQRAHQLARTA